MFHFHSINTRIVLAIGLVLVAAFGSLTWFVAASSYRMVLDSQLASMTEIDKQLVMSIQDLLDAHLVTTRDLADQSMTRRFLETGQDQEEMIRALQQHVEKTPGVRTLFVFNAKGQIVLGYDVKAHVIRDLDISQRFYTKEVLTGGRDVVNASPVQDKVDGTQVCHVASPIRSASGQVVGGVGEAFVWSDFVAEHITPIRFGSHGYAFLLDSQGTIIAHPSASLLSKNVANLEFARESLSKPSGTLSFAFEGVSKVGVFSTIKQTGWKVFMTATQDDLASTAVTLRNAVLIAGALGAALVLVLIVWLLRRMVVGPIKAIGTFASQITGGDFSATLDNHFSCELGILADNLRNMVANLKDRIHEADVNSREAEQQAKAAQQAMVAAEQSRQEAITKTKTMLETAEQLNKIVEIVTSASEELSSQIEQSSRGAEEQSQRVGETASSMEEMNATVLEVAQNASSAAATADQAKIKAEEGAGVVTKVVHGIEAVQQQSHEMKNDMGSLGKQAEGIGQILNVISDIADQTNLLALNAAIEAARAGEAGRGFAVVADEVRKLAEKTMTATKEVGEAIRGIQDGTKKNIENVERSARTIEEVTKLANTSGESLRQIVSLAEVTTDQVRSIATASEQQSSASEEINHSLEDVNRVSLETTDAMRQSAQAVAELANQAHVLKKLIDAMKSEDGSSATALPSGKKALALGRA